LEDLMTGSAAATETTTMRAVVHDTYGSADVLELRDIARPEIAADEVLVRVHAAGVDRGAWHLMTGLPYPIRLAGYGVRRPKRPVLGRELAGRVEAVGAAVTRFRPGDEVMGIGEGAFAEYASAREDKLVAKPANLTFEQAAAVPISATTALQALRDKGRVHQGQRVLVLGASGGVGTFAVQLAKAFGADVTGVASTAKVDLVRAIGADRVLDYTRDDVVDGTRQYDLILDIAGNRPLSQLRRALTPQGTLVLVGGEGGDRWWLDGLLRQFRALVLSLFVRQRLQRFLARERYEDLAALTPFLGDGRVRPVVDRTYSLSEVPQAMRDLEAGNARGKLVVTA
jgi:NADPH:quinone reductase-like Zn-dependent oxidoreductase